MGDMKKGGHPAGWLRAHLTMRRVLEGMLVVGLLAYVVDVAGASSSLDAIWMIFRQSWWIFLGLSVLYLAARALAWYLLLAGVGIRVPSRSFLAAFAAGQAAQALPGGDFAANYLLARLEHLDERATVRSVFATMLRGGLETVVALPLVLLVGIPGRPWAFWVFGAAALIWLILSVLAVLAIDRWSVGIQARIPLLGHLRAMGDEFLGAGRDLLTGKTLLVLLPTALYLAIYAVELYVVMRAMHLGNVSLLGALAAYAFIILVVILNPLPVEIGVTEVAGLGTLVAFGIPHATAAVVMLSFRVSATGFVVVISAIVVFLFGAGFESSPRQPDALPMGALPHAWPAVATCVCAASRDRARPRNGAAIARSESLPGRHRHS